MKFTRFIALLLAVLLFTSVIAPSVMAEETMQDETIEFEDQVLAYVNGTPVMLSMVSNYADEIYEYYSNEEEETEDSTRELYAQALTAAMGYVIMEQKAEEMGLKELTDEEYQAISADNSAQWSDYVEYYASMFGADEEADDETKAAARISALSYLESYGYTEESLLKDALDQAWYEKLIQMLTKDVSVTDEDVQAAFDETVETDKSYFEGNAMFYEFYSNYYEYESYYIPAGYRAVKQILLNVDEDLMANYQDLAAKLEEQAADSENGAATENTEAEDAVTPEMLAEAKAAIMASVQPTVDEINQKLAEGVAFDDLIQLYNVDPGMFSEPYATDGYQVHAESIIYDPSFVEAAFSLQKIGDVSEPYLGSYGIYIVYYLKDIPEGAIDFTDDIRAVLYNNLQSIKESEAVNAVVDGWLKESDWTYTKEAEDFLPFHYFDADAVETTPAAE